MSDSSGDLILTCDLCYQSYYAVVGHDCPARPPNRTGWICPVCGKGNSPYSLSCDCDGANISVSANTKDWNISEIRSIATDAFKDILSGEDRDE